MDLECRINPFKYLIIKDIIAKNEYPPPACMTRKALQDHNSSCPWRPTQLPALPAMQLRPRGDPGGPVRRGRQLPLRPRRQLRVQGQRGGHEVRRLQIGHLRSLQGQPGRMLSLLLLRQGQDVRAGQLGLDPGQI